MLSNNSSSSSNELIKLEQVRMLYCHLATSVSGTMFGAGLIAMALWPVVSAELMLIWLAAMAANQGWRLSLYFSFRRDGISSDRLRYWSLMWMIGAGISGALWAAANLLFFSVASPLHQAILITTTFAIVSVAVPLIASHLPSLYLFVGPVLLAIVLRSAWEMDTPHLILATIATALMISILSVGRRYHELLTASLRARFENESLAIRLAGQNMELDRARNAAEQASIAKSKFLAAASHDLRQPLHALTLFADALSNETDLQQVAKLTQHIGTSVTALETLFNSLLDISKLDAGVIRPQVKDFSAQELLDRIENDFSPFEAAKNLRIRIRPTSAQLKTDPVLLEQLLRNLVANAVRYTEKGAILVACRRRGDHWRIEVRDSGIGIPAESHQRVFEEFYQLGNPERDRQKGLGLGLAIVSRLSRLLSCPIELLSEPGRGTTMAVTVPAGTIGEPIAQTVLSHPDGFRCMRVLIIDDEPEVRAAMQIVMDKWGCDTIASESIGQAEIAMRERQWEPELAICDYRLKGDTDGIQALNSLREQFGMQLPCLLITGDIEADRLKAVRESGYLLLHKPVPPAKLRAVMGSLTSKAEELT